MKKNIFSVFRSILSAQSPEILGNNRDISKMVVSGQATASLIMQVPIGTSAFTGSGPAYELPSRCYNSAGSAITFSPTADREADVPWPFTTAPTQQQPRLMIRKTLIFISTPVQALFLITRFLLPVPATISFTAIPAFSGWVKA